MSDQAGERQSEERKAAEAGEESYEPPHLEDLPADGPAVTAAGAQNVLLTN